MTENIGQVNKEITTLLKSRTIEEIEEIFLVESPILFLFFELKKGAAKKFVPYSKDFIDLVLAYTDSEMKYDYLHKFNQLHFYSTNLKNLKTIEKSGAFLFKENTTLNKDVINSYFLQKDLNIFERAACSFNNGTQTGVLSSILLILKYLNEAPVSEESALIIKDSFEINDDEIYDYIFNLQLIKNNYINSLENLNNDLPDNDSFSALITLPFDDKYLKIKIVDSIRAPINFSQYLRKNAYKKNVLITNRLEKAQKPQNFIMPNRGMANGYSVLKGREIEFKGQLKEFSEKINSKQVQKEILYWIKNTFSENYRPSEKKLTKFKEEIFKADNDSSKNFAFYNKVLIKHIKETFFLTFSKYSYDENESEMLLFIIVEFQKLFNLTDSRINTLKKELL